MTSIEARSRGDLLDAVFESVREILPTVDPARLSPDVHLRDLGADSVDRVEIIMTVLDRLGVDEPLASFTDLTNIDGMVDLLYRRTRT
jgi:polyketide biosynthesis acyl carrier protein